MHGAHSRWRDVYTATTFALCHRPFTWTWRIIYLLDSKLFLSSVSLSKPRKGAAALAAGLYNILQKNIEHINQYLKNR